MTSKSWYAINPINQYIHHLLEFQQSTTNIYNLHVFIEFLKFA